MLPSRAWGLFAGAAADIIFGDPRRRHPVAAFARVARGLERLSYRDSRMVGALHVAGLVGSVVVAAAALQHRLRRCPGGPAVATAVAAWTALCGTSLRRECLHILRPLRDGDLATARARMPRLFFTNAPAIGDDEIVARIVLTVSENTLDAVVAPVFWGAVAGPPGLLGYRAVNTLDGMIGTRSHRYLRYGWAAARLDDVVNWVPARIAALAAVACAPVVGGSPTRAWQILRRDGALDPSPNSGPMYGACCGALGITLDRREGGAFPLRIGEGPPPTVEDAFRSIRLSRVVSVVCTAVLILSVSIVERVVTAQSRETRSRSARSRS